MENFKLGALCLAFWFLFPRTSWAEEFLHLPITRTPVITSGFCGYRTASGACHGGIDYDVRDDGDEVVAAAEGVVEAVSDGWSNTRRDNIVSYGNSVRVRHPNGYLTIYGHLKSGSLLVGVGDHVEVGARLGIGDNSGWSTGSHLHFEVRDSSGHKIDPYGDSPAYPNCGANRLWVDCPPTVWVDEDSDGDTWTISEGDCDDGNANVHPGAEERCNGIDDNCANGIDEEPAASTSCEDGMDCTANFCTSDTHVCSQFYVHDRCEDGDPCTTDLCTLVGCRAIPKDDDLDGFVDLACGGDDCDDGNFAVKPGAAESCNHIDDNCDGETDEDWRTGIGSDLGNPCEVGFGVCRRSDVWDCEPAGRGVVCYAEYVSPTGGETCDGLDNDCDDETDEDWPEIGLVCGTPPCEGIYVCASDGLGSSCNAIPGSSELCDGVDNDCDGAADESPEAEFACADGRDCTEDVCLFGLCQNVARDRDHDTHADDLCGGDDCNDLNSAVWSYALAESRFTSSVGVSHSPVIVWTGTELGIAWRDQRDGNPEIYFARADTSLAKIGGDTRVTIASDGSSEPSLVWTGSEYGLAWSDQRSWSTDVFFTRLDATGLEIGDDVPLTDNVLGNSSYSSSIVWTGSEFDVAFVDTRSGPGDIFLARLNSSGTEIGSETPLVTGFGAGWYPNFVWIGTEYGLAWNITAPGAQEVLFAHFTPLGSIVGSVVPIFSFAARSVTAYSNLVWQGREFALVWAADSTGNGEIYFSRVDASGAEIASETQITNNLDDSVMPTIAWRGDEYGLTWEENPSSLGTRIYFVRLDQSGDKLGSEFEISSSQQGGEGVPLVSTSREYFFAWADNRDGDWEIYLGRMGCGW
jgi:hypothetical protein